MPSSYIPTTLERLWGTWNIRGCMILAVCMQLLLAILAPHRRRSSNPVSIFLVWCTYLLADWTAVFAYGLITNSGCQSYPGQPSQVSGEYLTLWAAFLLVHLGGPDSITAFSLEDNALWPRHLVGLFAQVSGFLYILGKTLSEGKKVLMRPTMLVFLGGIIKYGERSRSLYLASLERMKRSGAKSLQLEPSEMDPSWRSAYRLSQRLKGLVVDVMPNNAELRESREFFLNEEVAEAALDVLTKEMSFLYDMLYTKTLSLRSGWGNFSRNFAYSSIVVISMWFFSLEKHEWHKVDYGITVLLVCEVCMLQIISLFMLFKPLWNTPIPRKLWSEAMGSFNLLSCCFEETTRGEGRPCREAFGSIARMIGVADKIIGIKYVSKIPFDVQLWKFVFDELKASLVTNVDVTREIYEARGDLALGKANCHHLMRFIKGLEFDSTLLTWHVATLICYYIDEAFGVDEIDNQNFSKTTSNYMVYLMVQRPKLMSPVIGIGYDRYIDTCEEMKRRGRSFHSTDMKDFCVKLLAQDGVDGEPGDGGRSVLFNSCDLTRILLTKDKKWKIISEVWVELLTFTAGHCRAESYARLLAEGGEFISFVWLLMAHLGIGPHVPVE